MNQLKSFALALSLQSVAAVDEVPNIATYDTAALAHSFQFAEGENRVVTNTALVGEEFQSKTTVTFPGEAYDLVTVISYDGTDDASFSVTTTF